MTASGAVLGTTQWFPDVGGQHDIALVERRHPHYAARPTRDRVISYRGIRVD